MATCIVQLALELTLIHFLPENPQNTPSVDDKYGCAVKCMEDSSCGSMVYDIVYGSCYLYNAILLANSTGVTDGDFLMYITDRGNLTVMEAAPETTTVEPTTVRPCLTAVGYVLNEALDLCYKIHSEGKSDPDANAACKAEGGTELVRVDTEGKLQLFMGLVPQYQYTRVNGYYVNGNWEYPAETNPQTIPYIQWSPGQPNGLTNNQHCLAVDSTGIHDAFCTASAPFPFICEM